MRGSNTLFADIIAPGVTDSIGMDEARVKGRSRANHDRRNECLVDRYFYYLFLPGKMRYDAVVEIIALEFFLSQITVIEVVDANAAQLRLLKAKKPGKAHFVRKWTHLRWDYKLIYEEEKSPV